jgi:hypothetical protein
MKNVFQLYIEHESKNAAIVERALQAYLEQQEESSASN